MKKILHPRIVIGFRMTGIRDTLYNVIQNKAKNQKVTEILRVVALRMKKTKKIYRLSF